MRVLIVEDDHRIAEPLADDLRRQRNIVDAVDNGLDGFTYARTGVHDVILLDVVLPGMDGIAVCAALRAAGCTAMIVMLTARDGTEHTVAGLDAGADDYLVKPFDYEDSQPDCEHSNDAAHRCAPTSCAPARLRSTSRRSACDSAAAPSHSRRRSSRFWNC